MKYRPAKLSELSEGMTVRLNIDSDCLENGASVDRVVKAKTVGTVTGLYVDCASGEHFLDGQLGEDGVLIGVSIPEEEVCL